MVNYPTVQPAGVCLPEGCCISGPPSALGERDIAQILTGSGLGSSETFREQPRCKGPCSKTGRKGGRSSDNVKHRGSFGWVDKEEPPLNHFCTVKNICLQVPAYNACSLSGHIFVLTSLYLLFCLYLYSSSQRKMWAVFHIP